MLRALFERLCRSGEFEPIGPDEMPELPAALASTFAKHDEPAVDRLERSDYVYTPSAIDLSGIETTYDPDDRRPWKPGEPRAELKGGWPLRDRLESESIVRELADHPESIVDGHCTVCRHFVDDLPFGEPARHKPTCAWLRARAWVEANPT